MTLIFCMALMCVVAGIGAQFDSMPSNDGAGKALAGAGTLVAAGSGWMMWGSV